MKTKFTNKIKFNILLFYTILTGIVLFDLCRCLLVLITFIPKIEPLTNNLLYLLLVLTFLMYLIIKALYNIFFNLAIKTVRIGINNWKKL